MSKHVGSTFSLEEEHEKLAVEHQTLLDYNARLLEEMNRLNAENVLQRAEVFSKGKEVAELKHLFEVEKANHGSLLNSFDTLRGENERLKSLERHYDAIDWGKIRGLELENRVLRQQTLDMAKQGTERDALLREAREVLIDHQKYLGRGFVGDQVELSKRSERVRATIDATLEEKE